MAQLPPYSQGISTQASRLLECRIMFSWRAYTISVFHVFLVALGNGKEEIFKILVLEYFGIESNDLKRNIAKV